MEEKKLKEIEAKLNKMLSEIEKDENKNTIAPGKFNGAKVIRRRKGQQDLHLT